MQIVFRNLLFFFENFAFWRVSFCNEAAKVWELMELMEDVISSLSQLIELHQ